MLSRTEVGGFCWEPVDVVAALLQLTGQTFGKIAKKFLALRALGQSCKQVNNLLFLKICFFSR